MALVYIETGYLVQHIAQASTSVLGVVQKRLRSYSRDCPNTDIGSPPRNTSCFHHKRRSAQYRHHKSYHPYGRDNVEKVRRDEEETRQKEAKEEGRMMLTDSEARTDRLREIAGSKNNSKRRKDDDDIAELVPGDP
ncbi:hypothetical protein B0H13DRAFT_1885655 [Mycena leptocephala]|nr:hypothetical protein B0H13DRAFT_1885655 [Mycena leptocephala]